MSQLFDYFVCARPEIEAWADAFQSQDEGTQHDIEATMPFSVTVKNVGQDCFNILASCAREGEVDVVEAVGILDLVREISEEGPWVMSFRQPTIEAIAGMDIDTQTLERWAACVAELYEGDVAIYRALLSADIARRFKDLCTVAIAKNLRVFTCFYG